MICLVCILSGTVKRIPARRCGQKILLLAEWNLEWSGENLEETSSFFLNDDVSKGNDAVEVSVGAWMLLSWEVENANTPNQEREKCFPGPRLCSSVTSPSGVVVGDGPNLVSM